jgi:ribosome-associated toxin RatA of RatAB toxin-antitoxin module
VWDLITDVAAYPEESSVVEWARIDSRVQEDGREKIDASMSIAIPQLPCEVALRAYYAPERGYMPFYLVEAKGNPMKHLQGYWSVTPYPGERVLILFLVDMAIDYPLPQELRVSLAEKGAKMLLEELASRAEATSVYE